jgi:hypothetical protein
MVLFKKLFMAVIITACFFYTTCSKIGMWYPYMLNKSDMVAVPLANGIYGNNYSIVKEALKKGADPNYCHGDAGWYDSNPLDLLVETIYVTYNRHDAIKTNIELPDDVKILYALLNAGADINKRPYIWHRVIQWDNETIKDIITRGDIYGHKRSDEEIRKNIDMYIQDSNRLLEEFLKSGADPDKKGHLYPYSKEVLLTMTDDEAEKYFKAGSRAINEAIKKGIIWEGQVDLLLRYTTLDGDSLKAAEESGDSAMIEKISKLWAEQYE